MLLSSSGLLISQYVLASQVNLLLGKCAFYLSRSEPIVPLATCSKRPAGKCGGSNTQGLAGGARSSRTAGGRKTKRDDGNDDDGDDDSDVQNYSYFGCDDIAGGQPSYTC